MRKFSALSAFLLFSASLHAATFIVASDADLYRKADAVVVATVIGSQSEFGEGGTLLTATQSRIEQVVKGPFTAGDLLVTETLGGTIGNFRKLIHGTPQFREGTRVLLFVFEWEKDRWATVDLTVGKFEFHADVRGREVVVRDSEAIGGWGHDLQPHVERRRDAAGFLAYLNALRSDTVPEASYFIDAEPLATLPAEPVTLAEGVVAPNVIVPPASNYILEQGGNNFRWNAFPGQVTFHSFTIIGETPVAGSDAAVAAGTAAWTNDCGSNVNLANGGASLLTPPAGLAGASDGENTVRWEVDIPTVLDYDCGTGGVLGLGGPQAFSGTHSFDSDTYFTLTEGDVDMNRGLGGCATALQSMKNAAVAHEIGHTMNFRHSDRNRNDDGACEAPLPCEFTTAVMRASLPNGLDAVLQPWDIDAVRAVYPGGSCGVARGSFNNDAMADVVWRHTNGSIVFWYMNAHQIIGAQDLTSVPSEWTLAGQGDLSGDGKTDIIWRHTNGSLVVWTLADATITGGIDIGSIPTSWEIVGIGNFNGDAYDDILWRNSGNGSLVVWTFGPGFAIGGTDLTTVATVWGVAGVADFDGDGSSDILFRHSGNGSLVIWFMDGFAIESGADVATVDLNWKVVGTADFSGDGKGDILWRHAISGGTVLWRMSGAGILGGGDLPTIPDLDWQIVGAK